MVSYYSRKFKIPFDDLVARITEALQENGLGTISCMDVKQTLNKELNVDFRNYKIISACNPEFVYKAISLESHIGVMVSCNILIQEHENGEVEVSAINPMETIDVSQMNPTVEEIALEISHRLRAVIDNIQKEKRKPEAPDRRDGPILWPSDRHFQEQYF